MNKIEYNRDKCSGCAICEMLAPQIWAMNREDGKADMLDTDTTASRYRDIFPDEIENLKKIVESCSGKAINILQKL